jgi:cytoplasmic iron level regulating protein YaaA (DUF328/UPF0246 family)
VRTRALRARVVTPVFEDWKGGRYKVISFYAKKARGMMVRHAVKRGAARVEQLQEFADAGYAYAADASSADTWVFRRRLAE